MRIILSLLAGISLAATACTESPSEPELGSPEEAVSLLAESGDLAALPSPEFVDDETSAAAAQFVGRYVKLLFGWHVSAMERIECLSLNMTSESIQIGDCTYTLRNQGCDSSWSESLGEYVCSCDVFVTGGTGSGC